MRRPYDAIAWWEKRRVVFNLVVLVVAAGSFAVVEVIGARGVQPGEDVVEPLLVLAGGAVFAIAANLCYTLGWMTELMWSEGDTSRTETIRRRVYRRGLIFSALVAAAPGVLAVALWMIFGFR